MSGLGFETKSCDIRKVCEIFKIDIAGTPGAIVKSISGRIIFNDYDEIHFRITVDKKLKKCFIRDVQLFGSDKEKFVDEIICPQDNQNNLTLTEGE